MTTETNITPLRPEPRLYSRDEHTISRQHISPNAIKVLYRLHNAGFRACLVGGGVRDLLLGREPKDFDIATDALPEQVRELFRNCRLIGRRVRLAHVRFGREIIEVATFRANHEPDSESAQINDDGRIVRDNVYGTIDDDVWRRDFTVNALYYDIADFSVIDYTGGFDDLRAGRMRLIGDPAQRYREDPVRMLRAIRFARKLGFKLESNAADAIPDMAHLLEEISPARLFDETIKPFHCGAAAPVLEALRQHDLFRYLFPAANATLASQSGGFPQMLIGRALENTDDRINAGKSVTPAFLVSAMLWQPLQDECEQLEKSGVAPRDAFELACDTVLSRQVASLAIPRRITQATREIWDLQGRLEKRLPSKIFRLLDHPRFRAAYDFLEIRVRAGAPLAETFDWWADIQQVDDPAREAMVQVLREARGGSDSKRPRRRRRRRRD